MLSVTSLQNFGHCRRSQGLFTDIASEFYLFGFDGISFVLFESRIGCLDPVLPEETECFIQSINTMFVMNLITMALSSWMYQLCSKPWNDFISPGTRYLNLQRVTLTNGCQPTPVAREDSGGARHPFPVTTNLPMKTIYSNVTKLLLARVDMISSTLSWTLYELSRHPEIQVEIRKELLTVLGGVG